MGMASCLWPGLYVLKAEVYAISDLCVLSEECTSSADSLRASTWWSERKSVRDSSIQYRFQNRS